MLSGEVAHNEYEEHDEQQARHHAKSHDHLVNERLFLLHLHLDGIGDRVVHGHGLVVVDDFEPVLVACLRHVDGISLRKYRDAIVQIDAVCLDEAVRLANVPVLRDRNVFHAPAPCQRHERHGQRSDREPLQPISSHNHVVLSLLKEPLGLPFPTLHKAVELSASCVDPPHELGLDKLLSHASLNHL